MKSALFFLISCFCGSLAVSIRPYLLIVAALIPLWATMSVQIESRKMNLHASVKICILWNLLVALFVLSVNVLPYAVAGELDSFTDGLKTTADYTLPENVWKILMDHAVAFGRMDVLSIFLSLSGLVFAVCYPISFLFGSARARRVLYGIDGADLAGERVSQAVIFRSVPAIFDLCMLVLVMPFAIEIMIITKHFHNTYYQFLAPFISIGAVTLYVMLFDKKPGIPQFLARHKIAVGLLALILAVVESKLDTNLRPDHRNMGASNVDALLTRYGLERDDFFAPYNMYVHWKLKSIRRGFPNAAHTYDITYGRIAPPPDKGGRYRFPENTADYCRMLSQHGPSLIVFFEDVPLARCDLPGYDFIDNTPTANGKADIKYHFIRRR